jgi:putative membrane protein
VVTGPAVAGPGVAAEEAIVSPGDRARVAAAIGAAERRTAGEIFVVLARRSDDYRVEAALAAALVALLVPVALIPFALSGAAVAGVQALAAVALGLLSQWEPVRLLVVPRAVKRRRAHRLATELFLSHNVHATPERTGVLLFVSVAERHAEVVADAGIFEKVAPEAWVAMVARLTARLAEGAVGEALVEAVEASGAVLAAHVPPDGRGRRDHLPNTLVEI